MNRRNLQQLTHDIGQIANFVRQRRKMLKLTQAQLALRTGVGLRFLRELELGKKSLKMDKVNQVLSFFGFSLGPIPIERISPFKRDEGYE